MSDEIIKQNVEERLILEWIKELSPSTQKNYRDSLVLFAKFIKAQDVLTALNHLFSLDQGKAFEVGQQFKNWLKGEDYAVGTVNMRMASLKSVVRQAQRAGRIPWLLTIRSEKAQPYKDTRGPGEDGIKKLVAAARSQRPAVAARDVAIIQLLFGQAFRRESVGCLDMEDLSADGHAMIHKKGFREKVEWPLGKETCDAINEWLKYRGTKPGPLFWPQSAGGGRNGGFKKGARLTGIYGVYPIIKRLAKKAGIKATPHGLRHTGTTVALDRTNGDVRSVARFTGHKNINTVLIYDDNRKAVEREISDLVSKPKENPNAKKDK